MAFIIFPMNALHAHESKEDPCHDHIDLAVDSCHISIFHDASELEHCDHKEHLVDRVEECDLCDVVTSRKLDFAVQASTYAPSITSEASNNSFVYDTAIQDFKSILQGRAPPVTYQG